MTRDEARALLALATGDNRDPMPPRYVMMGGQLTEYIAPIIFDTPEEVKRLADIAGVAVKVVSVNLTTLDVEYWDYPEKQA